MPEALLLDLDDTLLDGSYLAPSIRRTCETLVEASPSLTVEQLVAANGDAWDECWPRFEEAWTLGGLDSDAVRMEVWGRTLERCACTDASLSRLAVTTHARIERESFALFADAAALLQRGFLGVPLGLVTNGASDVQREKLRALGIEDRFSVVVVSGEVGRRKPDPAIFEKALDALGVEPSAAWHVGDNLVTDVGGARGSGLTGIWLNRRGHARDPQGPEPSIEIRSLAELASITTRA